MSFTDDMDPTTALSTLHSELVKHSKVDKFTEIVIKNEHDGLVSMHDFAEALEDCDVHVRTTLLRSLYTLLHSNEEDPEMLNRYVLVSAIKTGSASTMRAKVFAAHQRKRSFPGLELKVRTSLPPKTHIQTNDDESPTNALKQISLQIMGMGKYDELADSLTKMDTEKSGFVSCPLFADSLEDYSIYVRLVVIQGVFKHFDGKVIDGILCCNRQKLLGTMVEFAKDVKTPQPQSSDPDDEDDGKEQKKAFVKKFGKDLLKSPPDTLSGVNGLAMIAEQLEEKGTMARLEEQFGIIDDGVSVQDFADTLEDCDVHTRTKLIRRIYREIFNQKPDDYGIMSVNKHTLLISLKAQTKSARIIEKCTTARFSLIQTRNAPAATFDPNRRKSAPPSGSLDGDQGDDWKRKGEFRAMKDLI